MSLLLTRAVSRSRTTPAGGSGSRGRAGLCSCFLLNASGSPTPPSAGTQQHTGHTKVMQQIVFSHFQITRVLTLKYRVPTLFPKSNSSTFQASTWCIFQLQTTYLYTFTYSRAIISFLSSLYCEKFHVSTRL